MPSRFGEALDEGLEVEFASGDDGVVYPRLRSTCVPIFGRIHQVVSEICVVETSILLTLLLEGSGEALDEGLEGEIASGVDVVVYPRSRWTHKRNFNGFG